MPGTALQPGARRGNSRYPVDLDWLNASIDNAVNDFIFYKRLMSVLTVRNLPDEVHRAIRVRAALHGRSAEAEVRAIPHEAVRPAGRVRLGTLLAEIGREAALSDAEFAAFCHGDRTPAIPVSFE